MKTYKHLWTQFISDENYYLAVKNATKHKGGDKKKYKEAQYIKNHADELKEEIINYASNFTNSKHCAKQIYDGVRRKQRTIYVPTMKEQIIHHMVVNILKPIFLKGMYEHSYGSIPNRGPHKGKQKMEKWIRKNDFNYVLKMDIQKYFDSIPHYILKAKLHRIIKDKQFCQVLDTIIDVTEKGIPIGFYTSQWFANWYLTELDHYIKEELKVKNYMRYMDDMVILGNSKKELHQIRKSIDFYLNCDLGLQLKKNWQVYKFDNRDIDFMGFRFYKNRTIIRKSILLKASRKARKIHKNGITIYSSRQMLSYLSWFKYTDSYNCYKEWIKPYVSFHELKKFTSYWTKYRQGGKRIMDWYESASNELLPQIDENSSKNWIIIRKDFKLVPGTEDWPEYYTFKEQKIRKSDWGLYKSLLEHDKAFDDTFSAITELADMIAELEEKYGSS